MKRPLTCLFGTVAVFTITACSRHEPAPTAADLPTVIVQTAPVRQLETKPVVEVPGTVRPVDRATLSPRVMGTVTRVDVVLGQAVVAGDLLVEITANEISAQVTQAEAALAQTERDLARETSLLAQGASTTETVHNLEDRQRQLAAALGEARTFLNYTRVTAPFDGVITSKLVNVGDLATPGQPLLHIEGRGAYQVEAELPESLAQLAPGAPLVIRLDTNELTGRLAELSAAADAASRTVLAKIDLPADATVRSGQYARVAVPAGTGSVLSIPAEAVSPFGQMQRVFVVADGHATLRLVRPGATVDGAVEIPAGLNPGETVVVSPPAALRDGQPVESRR